MGITGGVPNRQPDWRDRALYEYSVSLSRRGWAWEFLRRNPGFRKAIRSLKPSLVRIDSPNTTFKTVSLVEALHPLEDWGVFYCDDLDKTAQDATVFWRPELCPSVVPVWAIPMNGTSSENRFSVSELRCEKAALVVPGRPAQLLLTDAGRAIQLTWKGADMLDDGLLLTAPIELFSRTERERLTMQRLWHLQRRGRVPRHLFRPHPAGERLRMALQVLDGRLAGASWRKVSEAVFGEERTAEAWASPSRSLLDRTRRLFWHGELYMREQYRELLR